MLEKNKGHLVTIASAAGTTGTKGLADYCASKHGAVGFDERFVDGMVGWADIITY